MILHIKKGIIYKIAKNTDLKRKAQILCHDVYLEVGYIKKAFPERIIPFEEEKKSVWIVAEKKDIIYGTICIAFPSSPLLFFKEWERKLFKDSKKLLRLISKDSFAELTRLAVKPEFRKKGISKGLYKACWLFGLLENINWYLIKMDIKALHSLEKLGWKVKKIGAPLFYMGSLTVPGVINVKEQLKQVYKNNFQYYKYLVS